MPTVVQGLGDIAEETILDKGVYGIECVEVVKMLTKSGKEGMNVSYVVISGRVQANGNDPEGTRLRDFFILEGFENHKDGGKFAKGKLNNCLRAHGVEITPEGGFDEAEMLNVKSLVIVRHGKDDLGEPAEDLRKYKPYVEEEEDY